MLLMTPHIHPPERIRRLGLLALAAQPPDHALAGGIRAESNAAVRQRRQPDVAVRLEAQVGAALVVDDGRGVAEELVGGKGLEGKGVGRGGLVVEEGWRRGGRG